MTFIKLKLFLPCLPLLCLFSCKVKAPIKEEDLAVSFPSFGPTGEKVSVTVDPQSTYILKLETASITTPYGDPNNLELKVKEITLAENIGSADLMVISLFGTVADGIIKQGGMLPVNQKVAPGSPTFDQQRTQRNLARISITNTSVVPMEPKEDTTGSVLITKLPTSREDALGFDVTLMIGLKKIHFHGTAELPTNWAGDWEETFRALKL